MLNNLNCLFTIPVFLSGSLSEVSKPTEMAGYTISLPKGASLESLANIAMLPSSNGEVTRIFFIRNGESDFNIKDLSGTTKFTSGRSPDVSLTLRGTEQAGQLGASLALKVRDGVIFTPPAKRTEQTAMEIVSQGQGIVFGGTFEGLFEVGNGEWEGTPKDQKYREEFQKWVGKSASEKYTSPRVNTGESYFEAATRALRDLQTIVDENPNKTIFIVSGENLLNALALNWTRPELSHELGSDLPLLPMEQCDLYMVEIPRGGSVEEAAFKAIYNLRP